MDAGGEDDRANGCEALRNRLSKEGAKQGHSGSQELDIRHDRRRSESFDCIALTGGTEGGSRHEGSLKLPPVLEFGEAVPSDANERQRWD